MIKLSEILKPNTELKAVALDINAPEIQSIILRVNKEQDKSMQLKNVGREEYEKRITI